LPFVACCDWMVWRHMGRKQGGKASLWKKKQILFIRSMSLDRISVGRVVFVIACVAILVFLMLPTLLVAVMSFGDAAHIELPPKALSWRWYSEFLTDPDWRAATLFSLKIASLTMACATLIGTMAAIALVRADLPLRPALQALVLAPLIVPHVILALALYLQFAPLKLVGTTLGFVLAHTMLAVPYVVLIVSAALTRVEPALEMAALGLGASRLRTHLEVTLPLIAPAIAAGALFAFLASFDEPVVSFFLSGSDNKTVTRKLFEDIDFNLSPVIAAASTVFMTMTIALALVARLTQNARNPPPTPS
jgi:mannopine transport system permease protein